MIDKVNQILSIQEARIIGLLQNPVLFKDWLLTLNPSTVAGEKGCAYTCPIAEYLQSNLYNPPSIGVCERYVVFDGYILYVMPEWANDFITNVDCYCGINFSEITAQECIDLLEDLKIC